MKSAPRNGAVPAGKSGGDAISVVANYKTRLCKFFQEGYCNRSNLCTYAHGDADLRNGVEGCTESGAGVSEGGGDTAGCKTKLCTLFQEGRCMNGARCSFAHGTEELKFFMFGGAEVLQGSGKGARTQLCRYFLQGQCVHGSECTYAHGNHELHHMGVNRGNARQWKSAGGKIGPAGAPCLGNATPHKTLICKFFMQFGSCEWGAECTFAHSIDEIHGFKTKICKYFSENSVCTRGDFCSFAHGQHELREPQGGLRRLGVEPADCAAATTSARAGTKGYQLGLDRDVRWGAGPDSFQDNVLKLNDIINPSGGHGIDGRIGNDVPYNMKGYGVD
mmetsp:Transcript_53594/g.149081  ORF Transcript_53594/g.149081 Transcript_53594/m.149081 type:complete len:333 (-) Transcript_53594:105-1103(-)